MPINFSRYIDLTPFDEEPASIYADALDYARLSLPELVIRQGTPEDAILQAASYITALNTRAINRLPDRLMAGLMSLLGLEYDDGIRAIINVEFTAFSNDGAVVPAGTIVRYDYDFIEPVISVQFETIEPLVIEAVAPESLTLPTGTVEARNISVGVLLPIANDAEMSLETTNTGLLSATFQGLVTDGRAAESDDYYLQRAALYVSSLSSAFCKASQIEAYVQSAYTNISRVKVYDLTDYDPDPIEYPDGPELDAPDSPGYVTLYVYGSGANASTELKTELLSDVINRAVAGLTVGVLDVVPAELSIEVDIGYYSSYDEIEVEDSVKQAILNAVSFEQSPFGDKLRKSYIYTELSSLESIAYIGDMTLTAEDGNSTITGGDAIYTLKGVLAFVDETNITINLTAVD